MFNYYGSKGKIVDLYPPPKFGKIIEPFAGSARYSLKYFDRDITLYDKYDVIVGIWKYLQNCSIGDILSLPNYKCGDKIKRDDFDCIEQSWLVGFMITNGVSYPMLTMSKWGEETYALRKQKIAEDLFKIKHWKILLGSYDEIGNIQATWFIDPPYKFGGDKYKHSNKKLDYAELAKWCIEREGHVLVCENTKADWMPFKPIANITGIKYTTTEAIWSNLPTNYDYQQQKLFAA